MAPSLMHGLAASSSLLCALLAFNVPNVTSIQTMNQGGLYGFTENPPAIHNGDGNMVLQQVWKYDYNTRPTTIRFSPVSTHVITVHKAGLIRVYDSIDSLDGQFKTALDIQAAVYDAGDEGLLGFELDPLYNGGTNKFAYIFYSGQPGMAFTAANYKVGWPNTKGNKQAAWQEPTCPTEFCGTFGVLQRIVLDVVAGTARVDATLIVDQCGGSMSHSVSSIAFTKNGDMITFWGDHGLWTRNVDPGFPDVDPCYDPTKSPGQGSFRSQRDDFIHGKGIRIKQASYRTSPGYAGGPGLVNIADYTVIAKGFRNPFRVRILDDDVIYVSDTGSGGAYGGEEGTERLYSWSLDQQDGVFNGGWPCVQTPSAMNMGEALGRRQWLQDNNRMAICQPIYDAVANPGNANLAKAYNRPRFQYRLGAVDKKQPGVANGDDAATSGFTRMSDSQTLGAPYRRAVFFTDFPKGGVYYFPKNADGSPNYGAGPNVLLSNTGLADMVQHPTTGMLYLVELARWRISRMYNAGTVAVVVAPPPPATNEPLPPRAPVLAAGMCHNPFNFPEIAWQQTPADGYYRATVTIQAATYTNRFGAVTTRALNGLIPGPIMRMEACKTYVVTMTNNMVGYATPNPRGAYNTWRDPYITNLHTHGLHISGNAGADDMSVEIGPGESHDYTYRMPCDHVGGIYYYHPHHHGSTTLHAGAGASAMLVVDDNPWIEDNNPYANLRTAHIVIQDMNPILSRNAAVSSKDEIFKSTAAAEHTLVNGCADFAMTIQTGQWTRLRMLHVANQRSAVVRFVNPAAGPNYAANTLNCEVFLLGLDGVYLADAPRSLNANKKLFFSIASRVDAAIRCNTAGTVLMQMMQMNPSTQYVTIGTITVAGAAPVPAQPALAAWKPCRPYYLADLRATAVSAANTFPVELRGAVNGEVLSEESIRTFPFDVVSEISLGGTFEHPFHLHINHVQLIESAAVLAQSQYADCPGWFVSGDFYDVVSIPAPVRTRFRADRYSGIQMLHCHIYQHSDYGVAAITTVGAGGQGPFASPAFKKLGTCPTKVRTVNGQIPGKIEAEDFDMGGPGVAYFETNAVNQGGALEYRPGEGVDVGLCGPGQCSGENGGMSIGYIEATEWLEYTIKVTAAGTYVPTLIVADPTTPAGTKRVVARVAALPGPCFAVNPNCANGQGIAIESTGTGGWGDYAPMTAAQSITMAAGVVCVRVCGAAAGWNADALTFAAGGGGGPVIVDPVGTGGDPTCALGLKHANPDTRVCCPPSCKTAAGASICGTALCNTGVNCCGSAVSQLPRRCKDVQAPCNGYIDQGAVVTDQADPNCTVGIKHADPAVKVCCPQSCRNAAGQSTCGTAECNANGLTGSTCCKSGVMALNRLCSAYPAPCSGYTAVPAAARKLRGDNGAQVDSAGNIIPL